MVNFFNSGSRNARSGLVRRGDAKANTPIIDRGIDESGRDPTSASSTSQVSSADLRYTKFKIAGMPGEKHAVFVPDTFTLTVPVLTQICTAMGKRMPSMLLSGVGSACHPARLSTPQLRACPAVQQLVAEARSSLGLPEDVSRELTHEDVAYGCCGGISVAEKENELFGESTNQTVVEIANRVLEKKIGSTISTVANNAYKTNVWTLSGPKLSSFEIFLQQCIENGETSVFRLVLGHVQDRSYMESDLSRHLMKQLFESSKVMSANVVEKFPPVVLPSDLWNKAKSRSNAEFSEHGWDYWSFETPDHPMFPGHPLSQWPWPHGDLFFLFYREERVIGTTTLDVDWEYLTARRLDLDAIPFTADNLAPVVQLFIGGRDPMIKRHLLTSIKLSKPVILLDNTPYLAKQVSLFMECIGKAWERNGLANCRPFFNDRASPNRSSTTQELIRALDPNKILKHVELGYDTGTMDADEKLTLSDIIGLLDLAQRRPQAFREGVCILDPLASDPTSMAPKLMQVFYSHLSSGKEAVSSNARHRSMVLSAWNLHLRMARRERELLRVATASAATIGAVLLLTTFLAIFMVHLHLQKDITAYLPQMDIEIIFTPLETMCFLSICLLVLPFSAGILTILQSYTRLPQKWANLHLASSQLVCAIYKFLGSVEPYDSDPVTNQQNFEAATQDILDHLRAHGVPEDDLRHENQPEVDMAWNDARALQEQINSNLYGVARSGWLCRRARQHVASLRGLGTEWPWESLLADGQEPRDPAGMLTTEAYVELRMAPLRKRYGEWLRWHCRIRLLLDIAFAVALSVGSGLGACGFSLWIPVALSVATMVSGLSNWLVPPEAFTAVNQGFMALTDLDLKLHGTDIHQKSSEAIKRRMISATENNALAIAMTLSRATWFPIDSAARWEGGIQTPGCNTTLSTSVGAPTPSFLDSHLSSGREATVQLMLAPTPVVPR
jgi:hypothetical protein